MMKATAMLLRMVFVSLALTIPLGCSPSLEGEQDSSKPAPTQSPQLTYPDTRDDQINSGSTVTRNEIFKNYKYLDDHLSLMDGFGNDKELEQSLDRLRNKPDIVNEVTTLYDILTKATTAEKHDGYGEARWRIVHVLGELKNPAARKPLFEIATTQLPDPKEVSEVAYKVEFRIRARAIAGLEKLNDVEQLQKIYDENRQLSGLAAASLYELGKPPKGIRLLDGKRVMGLGDPADFKAKEQGTARKGLRIPPATGILENLKMVTPVDAVKN